MVERRVYIAIEYLPGGNLGDRSMKCPLSFDEAIQITDEPIDGLDAVNDIGLTHRDVKPGNIRFTQQSEAVIPDFGLEKPLPL